ncbi:dynein regulatory complex protein 9-like [Melitaea cinxia]|uniref:dynein regulatory complex protein 9-like n=1 Tax=Melitaea cinxia TaxID=113334 RepID=UPI001E2708A7|nr:dynein regulatory complex protein 9-like [Melitaea cinxia]
MPTLLAHKYGVEEEKITDDLKDINPKNLDCSEYKLKKLQSDRIRRDLNRQIRQQRNHMKSVTYDTDNEIQHLKSSIEDAELTSATRSRYVEGWQRARIEQHTQTISHKEIGPTQMIEELKRKADQEQRVHAEIELLINIKINITKHAELIKSWIKFKEDREAARQYREKMTKSAIIVQAWWRGLLVRQQLGPYKVFKKKGQTKEEKSSKKRK